ncbi:MAG: hypothetical protein COX78_01815 [Candidatus Levybacteria bacterium CG_4_10_14_0_2_um_filter_35_8]|nr:MAG: hypothetical protein COX78_01815 [Candidatus Levybacteria bacterium CG_4_10_14_0_2_um_filter_35_8]
MCVKLIIFSVTFIFSRFFFANPLPVFFDSPEYLSRLSNPSLLSALTSGHIPLHGGYIFSFWPIYQFANVFNLNLGITVIFFQTLLAILGLLSFYKVIEFIVNKNVAFISLLIMAILPLFWISNVTIMMETTYLSYFFISLYFIARYLKSHNFLEIVLACLFYGFSFFTHIIVILWLPFILYLVYVKKKGLVIRISVFLLLTIFIFSLISGTLVAIAGNIKPIEGLFQFFSDPLKAHANLEINLKSIFVIFRNFLIPLLINNTGLIILISFIPLVTLFKKNRGLFIVSLLWIAPAFIANQWWDSLFFGRHALIASFCFSFLAALLIYKRKLLLYLVFLYLAITVLPAINLLRLPIPYLEVAKLAEKLPAGGIYIESHFARPQLTNKYHGTEIFIEEPNWNRNALTKQIDNALGSNLPVFVTSQALSEPYGLYSGPYLHSLSLSYNKDYILKSILTKYSIKKYIFVDEANNLGVYRIYNSNTPNYPDLPKLKISSKRLDYYDPISRLLFTTSKKLKLNF